MFPSRTAFSFVLERLSSPFGGAGDLTGSYLSGKTEDEKYVYTHIAASYAYAGEAGFTGCNYNDLVNAGVIAYINYLFGQEEPPKGELSLSSTKLNAVRDGNIQKTPNITLSGISGCQHQCSPCLSDRTI